MTISRLDATLVAPLHTFGTAGGRMRDPQTYDGKEAGTMANGHGESAAAPMGWRQGLTKRIDTLGASRGRFVEGPGADVETVPAERFFEPEFFAESIARHAGID